MNRPFLSMASRVFVLLALSRMPCLADTWLLPESKKYCSRTKQFCLDVSPKKLDSQLKYFQDKCEGKEDAGASASLKNNFCLGRSFKSEGDKKARLLWSRRLVNEVAPVSALVSESGNHVVTFDNWHSVGYGPDVVVIYGPEGKLIRQYGLEDFLNRDEMIRLDRSVSSIWWAGHKPQHYIEESTHMLVVKVVMRLKANGELFTDARSKSETREIRIDLSTGKILRAGEK